MKLQSKLLLFLFLPLLATVSGFSPASFGALRFSSDDKDEKKGEDAEDEEDEDEDKDKDKDRYLAVIDGDIYAGTGAVLRGASILSKNGVIEEIGHDLWIPEDAEIVNARGMRVYPGMIAVEANANIVVSSSRAADEGVTDLHPVDDEIDPVKIFEAFAEELVESRHAVEDSYDPYGQNLLLALATGITSTVSNGAAIKLKRGEIDDLVMSEGNYAAMSWSSKNPAGKRALREKFKAAGDYLREYREWEGRPKSEKDVKAPSDKAIDKNVVAVLTGTKRAKFTSNEQGDLLSLARFAQQFEFRPIIEGCIEGWTVAAELGRAGATAIITPRDRRDRNENLLRESGSTIENAAILYEHGVQIAIIPANTSIDMGGVMGRDLMHLPIEVGFAMRGGLPESAALASVTVVPARLLGISHRVGTLEVGKDCDLIVTDGDLLHYQTFVQYTVVDGSLAYDKQEEIFFAHIRPRAVEEVLDPGEEVVEDLDAETESSDSEVPEEVEETSDESGDDADEDAAESEDDSDEPAEESVEDGR